jgi:hypothetical protein
MTTEENEFLQTQVISITGNELKPEHSETAFSEKLAAYIHELINNDFQKLIAILYRLDVDEKKLKTLLAEKNATDAGIIIAGAIIERQREKFASRQKFGTSAKDIPDEEKW